MVASQRCKTVERSEDKHPYKPGTGVCGESWARAGQGFGGNPMHAVSSEFRMNYEGFIKLWLE